VFAVDISLVLASTRRNQELSEAKQTLLGSRGQESGGEKSLTFVTVRFEFFPATF
jgi:hypothetical protein